MNYKKHFAKILGIDPKLIVGFTPKDSNHTNCNLSNMLLVVDLNKWRWWHQHKYKDVEIKSRSILLSGMKLTRCYNKSVNTPTKLV